MLCAITITLLLWPVGQSCNYFLVNYLRKPLCWKLKIKVVFWFCKPSIYIYRPPTKLRKVMLSVSAVPCDHYPWCIGPYHTGISCTGPHCIKNPSPTPAQPQHPPLLLTSDGEDWRPVQTCSLVYYFEQETLLEYDLLFTTPCWQELNLIGSSLFLLGHFPTEIYCTVMFFCGFF